MACTHYIPKGVTAFCAVNAYGKGVQVGHKVCNKCPRYDGPVRGLGDVIHKVALPIAKAIKADCVDKDTGHLKPESPCQKKREKLNGDIQ